MPADDSDCHMDNETTFLTKVLQTVRQVLLGTSKTVYSTADDYKVKIACCPFSSWGITVASGVVSLLGYIACGGHELFIGAAVALPCLLGLFVKLPILLLPYRVLYGFLRVMFLFLVGLLGMGVIFTPVDIILEAINPEGRVSKQLEFLFAYFIGALLALGFYCYVGILAAAATKCVAQMRTEKEKNANLPDDEEALLGKM